jgi:methyl-accepting chemotaxis protein
MTRSFRRVLRSALGRDGRPVPDGGRTVEQSSEGDRAAKPITAHYGVEGTDLARLGNGAGLPDIGAAHVDRPTDVTASDIEGVVDRYRREGIDSTTFVASNRPAATGMVAAAFDALRERLDPSTHDDIEAVEAELTEAIGSVFETVETGVSAYKTGDDGSWGEVAGTPATEGTPEPTRTQRIQRALGVSAEDVLDKVGIPLFVTDAEGNAVVWNSSIEELTGVSAEDARDKEMLSQAFYHDGRRAKTLADKVLDAPQNADTDYGVERVAGVDYPLYQDTSVMADADGEDRHIDFRAAPIFDGEECVGVVELIYDRTGDERRQEELTKLVEHLTETMESLGAGKLGTRADPQVDRSVVDDEILAVIGPLNELAEQFETIAERVDEQTGKLATAIDESSMAAGNVETSVGDQREQLQSAAEEIQGVSASMEEIAATSDEVATSAQQALDAADHGVEASTEVHEVTDDLIEQSAELVESVEGLDERMDDIEEIVDVIGDVADQTNLLALNANIEAARAGEAGSGFAVVADEVKSLAEETGQYTDEISQNIDEIQQQTAETVDAVEDSHEQMGRAEDRIMESLEALEDINEAIEEAAEGITEVASANDDQATTIEGITTTIEDAHDRAREAESAVEDIVEATNRQTQVVQELYGTVDELIDRE